ncbi:ElaA protein [Weissella uvarum]|uniref:GNAT family N-acetyltransferase n=1 Tax=Weissella uvarum TaxID=1479233 RepID=UPI0019601525|nr:GNAT family N-acetyltransferase [Weissella uvarum]MBM7617607.1 ElaA protein [Weissella uvarum]MCM0595958.1 GNAT family N-acetyltransferase [Weissella uvarum]
MLDVKQTDELTPAELVSIMAERTAVFVVEQNCPYQEVDTDDYDALHVRLMEDGVMHAYGRIIQADDGIHFGRILVPKAFRHQGQAKKLIESILEVIKERFPNQPVLIQAQAYLVNFYQEFGFQPISGIYLEDGIPHLDMRLDWGN